ncbi:response regulator [Chrysiogenes arsenatis]|uniref:response regulator n=1 Tax=Chrysiogenes arsenatis TaxID=309797 RepID=UPI0003F6DDA8|nr:response regulator [Chrysiogenes arsenatis]
MPDLNKILLVEDEPDIQTIAKMTLELMGGFTVSVAEHGVKALEIVKIFQPDLILLDVMMPEMDGPTTLENLRCDPETKDIPVIFMTAKVQPPEVSHYKALGAIDVIAKPFDAMVLADTVRQLWRGHMERGNG